MLIPISNLIICRFSKIKPYIMLPTLNTKIKYRNDIYIPKLHRDLIFLRAPHWSF